MDNIICLTLIWFVKQVNFHNCFSTTALKISTARHNHHKLTISIIELVSTTFFQGQRVRIMDLTKLNNYDLCRDLPQFSSPGKCVVTLSTSITHTLPPCPLPRQRGSMPPAPVPTPPPSVATTPVKGVERGEIPR